MQRLIHSLAFALTLTGACAAGADQARQEDVQARFEAIATELQLTQEQTAQITPILQQEAADLKAVRDNPALRRRYKFKRFQGINEAASQHIRALLTPEQQAKYDAWREAQQAKRREQFKAQMNARKSTAPAPES